MIEIELKILLDAAGEARLGRHPALAAMRTEPPRTATLVSVYYDTPDDRLARAGIALRLRRTGRRWVQTVKRRRARGTSGLHANFELERPAPGCRLALDGQDPDKLYEAVAAALDRAAPEPRFETRVRRRIERLAVPGGVVELALDRGEIIAGALSAPIREAELELREGGVGAIFAAARVLIEAGPVRFALLNKAERGRRLAATGRTEAPPAPRKAGELGFAAEAGVETAARDVLRDCFAQIAANMVLVADSDDPGGPHQLRVGLRRLWTAFAIFRKRLDPTAFDALGAQARDLGRAAGRVRALDVLSDAAAQAAELGLDPGAGAALEAALEARRATLRAELRAELAAPEAVRFLFDLAEFIEARGWLTPGDYDQTARLAQPIGALAPELLAKRLAKVRKRAKGIEARSPEELHALRKELKKLRYAADALGGVFPGKKVGRYIKRLKALQDRFGSLNDAKSAAELLGGPNGLILRDAAAARGAGFVLGMLAASAASDRPRVFARWRKLAASKPFWA